VVIDALRVVTGELLLEWARLVGVNMQHLNKQFRRATAGLALLAFLVSGGSYPAGAQTGMVAAAEPLAIEAGERVLASGGNAIEAAVVAAAVLNVVEPYASGIGGGGFMVVHIASTGQEFVIDSNVTAPQATTPNMFIDPATGAPYPAREINSGGIAVGVPGALRHWDEALRLSQFLLGGTMSLRDALQPAIDLATNGFPVSASFLAIRDRHRTRLNFFPDTRAIFFPSPPLEEGSILRQPELAATLQAIADQGIDVFYIGPIADAISEIVRTPQVENPTFPIHPGRIDPSDLAFYEIRNRDAVSGTYRGFRIVSSGPPSAGITLIEMLNILEGFPLGDATFGFLEPNTAQAMIEAMKLSYADRTRWIADPAFVTVPVVGLMSRDYATTRRQLIQLDSSLTEGSQLAGDPRPFDTSPAVPRRTEVPGELVQASTTHLSVIDSHGNMVSYTTTLSELWGSGMVVPGYGFLLNNSLRNFSTSTTGINSPRPGKRPRSFISPSLVFTPDGQPRLVIGSAGGGTIPAILLEVITGVLDHQKTVQDAISASRFENENSSTQHTRYENVTPDFDLPASLVQELMNRGQVMSRYTIPPSTQPVTFGASQGIEIDPVTGNLGRGRDPRRGGDF
jgi:gamma-glutamyltranspeptidase / glutathione hydrolase